MGAVGLLLLMAVLAIGFLTATGAGLGLLAKTVSNLASNGEGEVRITGISGVWTGETKVTSVVLSDRKGVYARIFGIGVDWDRAALLSGTFRASSLTAAKAEIIRQPVPKDEESGSGGLPIQLDLQAIRLPELVVGEALIGQAMTFKVEAVLSALADPVTIASSFKITPGNREGVLEGTFSLDADTANLNLDVRLREPEGGVLATAFDLPGKPAVGLSATAEGPLEALTFSLQGEVGGNRIIDVKGDAGLKNETFFIKAEGDGTPSRIVPPRYRQLLSGSFALNVDLSGETTGRLSVNSAKIDGDRFFAVLRGDLDLLGQSDLSGGWTARDGAVNLTAGLVPELKELAVRSIAFSVKGPSHAAAVIASVDMPVLDTGKMRFGGIRANVSAPALNLEEQSGDFKVEIEADEGGFDNADLQRLFSSRIYGEAQGAIDGDRIDIAQIRLDNDALVANGEAGIDLGKQAIEGGLELRIGASHLPPSLPSLSEEDARIDIRFAVLPGGDIRISGLKAVFGSLSAEGSAALSGEEITASLTADLKAMNGLDPKLKGALLLAAELSGRINSPVIDLTATSNRIEANGHVLTDLSARLSGLADAAKPDVDLALSGTLDGLPLTGKAQLISEAGVRLLKNLVLTNGENRVSGNIALAGDGTPEGKLAIQLPDVSAFAALAGQELKGGLEGRLNFSKRDGVPFVDARFTSERLSSGELEVEALAADIAARDYLAAAAFEGVARIGSLRQGGTAIRPLEVRFAFDDGWTRFDARGTSDGVPVSVDGRVRPADGAVAIELDKASAVFRGVALALASPAAITVRDGIVSLAQLAISAGGGVASLSGTAGETLDLSADLSGIGASVADKFVPGLNAGGSISGLVKVTGKPADPDVKFNITWNNAATAETRAAGLGALKVSADGRFASQVLAISLAASGGGGIDLKGQGNVALGSAQRLDFNLRGTVPYSVLAAQLARQGMVLRGNAAVDLKLSGSPSSPVINGTVSSAGGRFVHAESGIAVDELGLAARFDGTRAVIEKLNGRLSTGGTVQASGNVGLSGGFPADFSVKVNNGRYSDRRTVDATFDADLKISGALVGDPLLAGSINLATAVITVPERLPASISRLDVSHRNASESVARQSEKLQSRNAGSSGGSSGLRLDLTLNAPRRVFVRGRGIDAELGGSMQLRGPVSRTATLGGFEMRRGRLSILGKRLDFTRGNIAFAGSLVPRLDMVAQTASGSTTILVTVSGQADQPEFLFSSVPPLAEDEVLARLIFNNNLSNLSPLQIAQLAQAAATLAGKGGNTSLVGKLQNALQVDDLDVRTDSETGETTVGVGRYVNDRTYVGVERGQTGGSGKVRIDLNVGRGVKLRGEATESGKNKAGIFYEREY